VDTQAPRVLTGKADDVQAKAPARTHSIDTSVWMWVGLAFLIVGGADLLLTWLPAQFGNREWEFGTVTSTLNGLPVPMLGMAAMLWAASEGRRRWLAALSLVAALVMLLGILGGLVLWGTGIPLALGAVPAQAAVGLKKALVKTGVQGIVYPLLLVYMIRRAWRAVRART